MSTEEAMSTQEDEDEREEKAEEQTAQQLWITPKYKNSFRSLRNHVLTHLSTGPRPHRNQSRNQRLANTPQPSSLAFVNFTGRPIRNVGIQREIRRHVMRDIGRGRRKVPAASSSDSTTGLGIPYTASEPSSPNVKNEDEKQYGMPRSQEGRQNFGSGNEVGVEDEAGLSISRFSAGRIDPFVPWPVELDARTQRLIDHRTYRDFSYLQICWACFLPAHNASRDYHIQCLTSWSSTNHSCTVFTDQRVPIKFYRDAIFPLGLCGPASFFQVLANFSMYAQIQPRTAFNRNLQKYEEWEGLYYQGKAMRIVKELLVIDSVSDELVAAMLGLACYSNSK